MVYHVSGTQGLKVLTPHVSTHGKAWVYAVEDLVTGLLFGVRHDDFDFKIDTGDNGRPVVYECYPGAFGRVYMGRGCSVYELDGKDFLRGMTSWSPELVCEHEVTVLNEIPVEDIYARLLSEEASGGLVIHRYSEDAGYKKLISEHIVHRLILFDAMGYLKTDERFQTYFKNLIEALRDIMDGHLL